MRDESRELKPGDMIQCRYFSQKMSDYVFEAVMEVLEVRGAVRAKDVVTGEDVYVHTHTIRRLTPTEALVRVSERRGPMPQEGQEA